MSGGGPKDLALLVADKNMEGSLRGILSRPQALGLREISFRIFVHPDRDPGCLLRPQEVLGPLATQYNRALVLLDHEGCGQQTVERSKLESEIEERLGKVGWEGRTAAVVIAPELENWVWSDSPHVETVLGWEGRSPALREWLASNGYLTQGKPKPDRPKMAVEKALRIARIPRSSALYFQLGQKVSFERCTDEAFTKLKTTLRQWFARKP
jgi:hypothetical protein